VRSVEIAKDGFDARRSAKARLYRYLILSADDPDPLISPIVWHISVPLDLRSMRAAADALLGEHNFAAFCRRPPGHPEGEPITRRVLDTRWTEFGYSGGGVATDASGSDGARLLQFEISASSFCHQMVRSVVGVLVDVGRGRLKPSDVRRLLESGDRSGAKTLAPAEGLCLMEVDY
jgi:tRNA pseudouridine38-40 synthase